MADKIFKSVPIEMPNKSGFDMSHENFFTATCGTLTPCLVDYLLPNDTVSLGFNAQIQLPPMATDFYGEIVGKYELFFVPYRLLFGGWKEVVAPSQSTSQNADGTLVSSNSVSLPSISFYTKVDQGSQWDAPVLPCSLADYLGFKVYYNSVQEDERFNVFPFLAYHKIYDDWYRDARVTKPCFYNATGNNVYSMPFTVVSGGVVMSNSELYNGHLISDLWQRNWPKDYFTNATVQPEAGDPASLKFAVDDGEGSFTIAGLRAANSLQMFMERNNIAGNRYQDRIRAHYGVYPSDAVTDRAIYLGSGVVNVYCKSIFQSGSSVSSANPFNTVGSKYGSSQGVGGGSLCKKFTATEHGILMCIFSLVPRRYYAARAANASA